MFALPSRKKGDAFVRYGNWLKVLGSGLDANQDLIELLEKLLRFVSWREALARACVELLEGEWADRYLQSLSSHEGVRLWPSQRKGIGQALYLLETAGGVLVADATGSGKTRMGVHLLRAMYDRIWSMSRGHKGLMTMVCPPWLRLIGTVNVPIASYH